MSSPRPPRAIIELIEMQTFGIVLASAVSGFCIVFAIASSRAEEPAARRADFARPAFLPTPTGEADRPAAIELGARLFADIRLSGTGTISCASCHIPELGFADGVPLSRAGATGVQLRRHTPALWNLAWTPELMWDGRGGGLATQARLPMSHPDEMASSPADAARRLAVDPGMGAAFADAFPSRPEISPDNVLEALAAYERTLVSPPTRFDRWVAGDAKALSDEEKRGFALFTGKARCSNCHQGFAFTDNAFHDIGLPTDDLGRGPVAELPAADRAFKTPGLRELAWTAPYMHDGSLATLEDVLHHYESGGIARPTRSRDMPPAGLLSDGERADLIAFLLSLSSDEPPRPSTEPWVRVSQPIRRVPAVAQTNVSQRDKAFSPAAVRIKRGATLTINNDDTRTHNVRIVDPRFSFNSGAQDPGGSVTLSLPSPGTYEAHCGIHPTMHLSIEVTE
ncbi:MAG: c-type cytochrome [Proteobacteria bacterium]|nr:c-type cytochrome [Pseudomonadota bacterium]